MPEIDNPLFSKATDIYTDRVEPRELFWKTYARTKISSGAFKPSVIYYYGIGGIGKTWLINWLGNEINEKQPKAKYIELKFDIDTKPKNFLEKLKNKITNKYPAVQFSRYDLANFYYLIKSGADISDPSIKTFINKSSTIKTFLSKLEIIESATSFVSENANYIVPERMNIEFLSNITGITSNFDRVFRMGDSIVSYLKMNKITKSESMKKFIESTEDEMERALPYYFALDLEEHLKSEAEPLTIFIDTYEYLQYQENKTSTKISIEDILCNDHGIIKALRNVIWVIMGRDKLYWNRYGFKKEDIEVHNLGYLSSADTKNYLECAGVSEVDLYDEIYEQTKGLPIFLDSFMTFYKKSKESGDKLYVNKLKFLNFENLFRRYIEVLNDDASLENIFLLSCMPYWKDEILREAYEKLKLSYNAVTYSRIKNMSFINQINYDDNIANIKYAINPLIRNIIYRFCLPDIKVNFTKYLEDFKNSKLKIVRDEEQISELQPINTSDFEWYISTKLMLAIEENQLDDFFKDDLSFIHEIITYMYVDKGVFIEIDDILSNITYILLRDSEKSIIVPEILNMIVLMLSEVRYSLIKYSSNSNADAITTMIDDRIGNLALKSVNYIKTLKGISISKKIELYIKAIDFAPSKLNHEKYLIYLFSFKKSKAYNLDKRFMNLILYNLIHLANQQKKYLEIEDYLIEVLINNINFTISDVESSNSYGYISNMDPVTSLYSTKTSVPYDELFTIYDELIENGIAEKTELIVELIDKLICDLSVETDLLSSDITFSVEQAQRKLMLCKNKIM